MEKPEKHSHLPKVEQDDILKLTQEEIVNNNNIARWSKFAEEDPVMAKEIIKRAYIEASQSIRSGENEVQLQLRIMDIVTYYIEAKGIALERVGNHNGEEISVGDDGVDLQP